MVKDAFKIVRDVGLKIPDVEATVRYDGSPVLKVDGVFMAGLARHPSAQPDTLVVRVDFEERELLLEDAPEIYYVTDYYRPYPIVLVRLSQVDRDALHDLLSVSRRLAVAKTRDGRARSQKSNRFVNLTVKPRPTSNPDTVLRCSLYTTYRSLSGL